ncbi:hypothetical protein JKA74_12685 [Marivirga sp. S37H4]|uniref:Uncharacterized protein n=1 Tax=Marivirga aurantiaca TaxID=2802615 RepID=A0A934X010_9BACT|nr:hypothetical protein [Marivirga aurantiaca]MBK6265891.1 hypothetical protein [Marivirga aurantiaca]
MKKILLLIAFVITIANQSFAQRLDKEKGRLKYTQLPLTPLPEDFTQYWVNIDLGYIFPGDSKTETLNKIKNAASISHLEKTTNEGVELLVRLETYYKSEVVFGTVKKDEKRDDKSVTVTYYNVTFDYKYPLYFEINLPGEVDPLNSGFSNNSNQMVTYESKLFKTSKERNDWWNANYSTLQGNLRTALLNANVSKLGNSLDNLYSYSKNSNYTEFVAVKKFKKFEYNDLDLALEKVKAAIEEISENDIVFNDKFTALMDEAIVIWNKALEESDLESKKTRINKKVTEAIYNNLCLTYVLMSEFEKADEVIKIAQETIGKRAIDSYIESFLNDRRARFEANEGRIPASYEG